MSDNDKYIAVDTGCDEIIAFGGSREALMMALDNIVESGERDDMEDIAIFQLVGRGQVEKKVNITFAV